MNSLATLDQVMATKYKKYLTSNHGADVEELNSMTFNDLQVLARNSGFLSGRERRATAAAQSGVRGQWWWSYL